MKDKVNFLIKFLILTIVLFIIWIPLGKIYLLLLAGVSKYVLLVIGYHATPYVADAPAFICRGYLIGMEEYAHLVNYNSIPLVALIIATSNIELNRRIKMLLIGVSVLFCMHVIDFVAHFPLVCNGSWIAETIVIFMAVGKVAVPFVLWFVLAYKEILGG
ncbi:MAG: hypothetical protein C4B59_08730 [Candidatus Methanogaster sp.]|uniref:Uncharacterized protein n=1 Tax=Candidatus Methanogaster sp. TaxID=3386292 RepID=A0AC61L2I7_9EURY|nr:MAG: hypothetical protein C4B59_08730 [ANME-2 cluster archaeon]